jgi:hypothetical protein
MQNTNSDSQNQQQPPYDPRAAFLLRAAVRFELVEAGAIDLAEAFDGLGVIFDDEVAS